MTKRDRGIVHQYLQSTSYNLNDVYGSYSKAKARAWDNCVEQMYLDGGYNLKIISSNSQIFTVGYTVKNDDEVAIVYITPTKKRLLRF